MEILRALSVHGEVRLLVGDPTETDVASSGCVVAPYEQILFLLVSKGGRTAEALNSTNQALVRAKTDDYSIELKGRALLGPSLAIHPRRLELMDWLPVGMNHSRYAVIHFWTEHVDYKRGDDEFFGKTPAAMNQPGMSTRWVMSSYAWSWPLLVLGVPLAVLYIAWGDISTRAVPVALAWIVIPCWVAGPALWYRAASFGAWQRGRGSDAASGVIAEALLPPGRVMGTCITLHVLGLLAFLPLFLWSADIPGIVFFCGFLWLSWPIALTRVFTGEKKET